MPDDPASGAERAAARGRVAVAPQSAKERRAVEPEALVSVHGTSLLVAAAPAARSGSCRA